jgi:hypothetical protein
MTFMELFAFVIMPVAVVAIGSFGAWLHMRDLKHHHPSHPAE